MIDATQFDDFLLKHKLRASFEAPIYMPLTGGVSSDIYSVELPGRTICIKRALSKLKVAADWEAPLSRSDFEWRWINFAAGVVPHSVPSPLAHDAESGLFAMAFLNPDDHPVWKGQLLAGNVVPETASSVGAITGQIHAASTRHAGLREQFNSALNFYALRLDPYFLATAHRHPDIAKQLQDLVDRTSSREIALVHGDISPKNILVSPDGPVILDAECACFGDPAFDLAFCLNHILLKCLVVPDRSMGLRVSFDELCHAYFQKVTWEDPRHIEARATELLPALLLARIDGKSPVEYIVEEQQRKIIRDYTIPLIREPATRLDDVAHAWFGKFKA